MYLLDTNVFIEAKNRYYAFDLAPGFWDWLAVAEESNLILSTEGVKSELIRGEDELATWARNSSTLFRPIDAPTINMMRELSTWARSGNYSEAAVAEFLSIADYTLVAYAAAHELVLVTHEQPAPAATRRIPTPSACAALDVEYCTTFTMLRAHGVQLGLS
ncbi:DUF4411 family protein [Mycetocola saprophilus]|uniref:DUF4411 family protein n=1 Tax=Mycetocola saprophilus TaxID=76636 RepID=UPI0004BFD840|nr:DUF4411 family protein [Mycetocola saprophilus]